MSQLNESEIKELAGLARAKGEPLDLRGRELSNLGLYRADLRGAVFSGADLTSTRLGEADLTGADLSKALLSGASFRGAKT